MTPNKHIRNAIYANCNAKLETFFACDRWQSSRQLQFSLIQPLGKFIQTDWAKKEIQFWPYLAGSP